MAEPLLVTSAVLIVIAGIAAPWALVGGLALAFVSRGVASEAASAWSKWALQVGVVALGFGVGLGALRTAGPIALAIGGATVIVVLVASLVLGRMLGVARPARWLHASGAAICGGSAIAAIATAVRATPRDVAVALAVVFGLNAAAVFAFPFIGAWAGLNAEAFGIWVALAVHDTASVVATASTAGPVALQTAVVWKLARAIWIAPLAIIAARAFGGQGRGTVPWFIWGFLGAVAIRTAAPATAAIAPLGKAAIVAAIFWVGASWRPGMFADVRPRHLAQPVTIWLALAGVSLFAVRAWA